MKKALVSLSKKHQGQRGDSIIEVLLAVTILSTVILGSIHIMNRGVMTTQRSLEITQVRNQIDNQANLIRHISNLATAGSGKILDPASSENAAYWNKVVSKAQASAPNFDDITECEPSQVASGAFFITPDGDAVDFASNSSSPETFARIINTKGKYESQMLWVHAVKNPGSAGSNALAGSLTDFHIRGCWYDPESSHIMKIGTIIRVYGER